MKQNLGTLDSVLRLFLAFAFAVIYFSGNVENYVLATTLWVLGIILFITGIVGFCPIYHIFKWRTNRKGKGRGYKRSVQPKH